jgi:predicted Zn-dependent protease
VATPEPPPPSPEALLAEARARREAGDAEGAREKLEAALAAAPSDPIRLELADLLVSDGRDLDRAQALLGDVRDRTADVRYDLVTARVAETRGDDAAAVAAYRRALGIAEDADVRLRRALLLQRLDDLPEAARELERVRALRPDEAAVHERLAAVYEAQRRIGDAEAEWLAAARVPPERAAAYTRLARFYERIGRRDAAHRAEVHARALGAPAERKLRPLLRSRR